MWSKCSSESKNHQLFDHNDKHGVKLSQQRRSHYVANYQEFQKNVSLKLLQESLPRQMTELKLLTSQKVKSKKIISNSTRATKLICSPKKLWRDGYIRYINHCVIVKNLAEIQNIQIWWAWTLAVSHTGCHCLQTLTNHCATSSTKEEKENKREGDWRRWWR